MDFTYRSTTGPYTTVRRQQRLLRLRRLQDGDNDHHTTTGWRLRPSHDYRVATTTITTTGRRLRPSRLQGGDYDHHDNRTATTTITTPGWRPPRVRRHNQDVHHVMFHQVHTSYTRIYFKPEADQPHYLTDYKLKETTFSTICI